MNKSVARNLVKEISVLFWHWSHFTSLDVQFHICKMK